MNRIAVALGLVLVLECAVAAALMIPLPIEEMVRHSQLIVHGKVLSQTCQRDPEGRIYTKVGLEVLDVWKGSVSRKPLTVVHSGGTLGEERVAAAGQVEYRLGEEVVAFLVLNQRGEAVTLGMAQGKFHVWQEQNGGARYVANPFHGRGGSSSLQLQTRNSPASGRLTLDDLKERVTGGKQ